MSDVTSQQTKYLGPSFLISRGKMEELRWSLKVAGVNAVGEVVHSNSEAIQRTPNHLVRFLLFPKLLNT